MGRKKLHPNSPEAIDAAVEMIRRMSPEAALAFLTYRTPGIEETDMTGMLSSTTSDQKQKRNKRSIKAA